MCPTGCHRAIGIQIIPAARTIQPATVNRTIGIHPVPLTTDNIPSRIAYHSSASVAVVQTAVCITEKSGLHNTGTSFHIVPFAIDYSPAFCRCSVFVPVPIAINLLPAIAKNLCCSSLCRIKHILFSIDCLLSGLCNTVFQEIYFAIDVLHTVLCFVGSTVLFQIEPGFICHILPAGFNCSHTFCAVEPYIADIFPTIHRLVYRTVCFQRIPGFLDILPASFFCCIHCPTIFIQISPRSILFYPAALLDISQAFFRCISIF